MKLAIKWFTAPLIIICCKTMVTLAKNVTANADTVVSTTAKSVTYAEAVHKINSADGDVTDTSENDFVDNGSLLINVTLSEFDNSTEKGDSEADDIHSSFNLAIIPAVAVFVFIVISCIKCCKWFRHYTRGDNKDENYYAVIVTDEDKDYGQIDIQSESASTACYDTVSSYTSFLKRSGNDSTFNSIRTFRQEGSKLYHCATSRSGNDPLCRVSRTDVKKNSSVDTVTKSVSSCQAKTKDVAQGSYDIRTSSTSSTETVSEQLTDSPAIRRNNRFRVSFVTEKPGTKPSTSENKFPNNNNTAKTDRVMRSSLKKPSTREYKMPDIESQCSSTNKVAENVTMVDVGTQTNKSFRYSLRKTKGHVSDSDIDERLLLKESHSLHDDVVMRNRDKHINSVMHVKHSSLSAEENSEPSNPVSEISKYPFDTNVEVIDNSREVKELIEGFEDDDVFVKEEVTVGTSPLLVKKNTSSDSCRNSKNRNRESLNNSVSETNVYSCFNCNPQTPQMSQNISDHVCDKNPKQDAENEDVIKKYCEKCERLRTGNHKELYEAETKDAEELLLGSQCRYSAGAPSESSERPSSSLSLESSGYAELSSTDSSSSTH